MGDTITTGGGIHNVTRDPGYDRRHWRTKDSTDWPTLLIETPEMIARCRSLMGVQSIMVGPKLTPINFFVEPAAIAVMLRGWDTLTQTGDERLAEMLDRRPSPIYLKRGVNQILAHKPRD